jgi:hypothetical protein
VERPVPTRPERMTDATYNIEWTTLMTEALIMPDSLGHTYNRFYNYSFLNQILLKRTLGKGRAKRTLDELGSMPNW